MDWQIQPRQAPEVEEASPWTRTSILFFPLSRGLGSAILGFNRSGNFNYSGTTNLASVARYRIRLYDKEHFL